MELGLRSLWAFSDIGSTEEVMLKILSGRNCQIGPNVAEVVLCVTCTSSHMY